MQQNLVLRVLIILMSITLANCASNSLGTVEPTTDSNDQQQDNNVDSTQNFQSYPYNQAPTGYDSYNHVQEDNTNLNSETITVNSTVSQDRIVYFDYDSSTIRAESRPVIEANARTLNNNRRNITQLEGHTDERGSREYNIALGERRANAVRQYMLGLGVSPKQIRVVSYGEERPATVGQDERHYALNRRVEIIY